MLSNDMRFHGVLVRILIETLNSPKIKPVNLRAFFIVIFFLTGSNLFSQEVWNGNFIEFTKDSLADWTLEENQDRITENVWITRKNIRGIYNIAVENGFSHLNGSPIDTEWAFGTTAEYDQLLYEPWSSAIDSMVNLMIGEDMVVHLITDDIYIDIKVLEWGITQAGGGYVRYERATENVPLYTRELDAKDLTIYPNPARDHLRIDGCKSPASFRIMGVSGELVKDGTYATNHIVDISQLPKGMYFVVLEEKHLLKFIKE